MAHTNAEGYGQNPCKGSLRQARAMARWPANFAKICLRSEKKKRHDQP